MESSEDKASPKSEKASPSAQEQTNIHFYPDWAAMQAYYGHGVPLPPPYFNSAIATGHVTHPNMWVPPQPMMPPYGLPYSTIYSHGVVYAHPAVPVVANPSSTELHSKSSDNLDQDLTKRLKRSDGLAVPVGDDSAEVDPAGSVHDASHSVEHGIDASSDGSDGKTGVHQNQRESNSRGMLSNDNNVKVHTQTSPIPGGKANITSSGVSGITVAPVNIGEFPNAKAESSPADGGLPRVVWVQDERQLKRDRRKQANRESARKSRLRKQAETEELLISYESLKVENMTLKSELNQLTEESEKVRIENAALMDKLGNEELEQPIEKIPDQVKPDLALPNSNENGVKQESSDRICRNKEKERKTTLQKPLPLTG